MKWLLIPVILMAFAACDEKPRLSNEEIIKAARDCCQAGLIPGYTTPWAGPHIGAVICRPSLDLREKEKFDLACTEILKRSQGPQASGACLDLPDTAGFPPEDAYASGPRASVPTGPIP